MPDRTVSTRAPITRATPTSISTAPVSAPSRVVDVLPIIPSSRTLSSENRPVVDATPQTPPSDSTLSGINQAILSNAPNYSALANAIGGYALGSTYANQSNGNSTIDTNNPQTNAPIYGTGNPFDILGDAFTKAFGGSTYNPQPQQPSTIVQPVGTSGGGSSIALILILAAIGGGIYYWYKHRG